jgi:hypothetical protein
MLIFLLVTVEERTRMRVHIFVAWEASLLDLPEAGVTTAFD